jgi:hypothetical protein
VRHDGCRRGGRGSGPRAHCGTVKEHGPSEAVGSAAVVVGAGSAMVMASGSGRREGRICDILGDGS